MHYLWRGLQTDYKARKHYEHDYEQGSIQVTEYETVWQQWTQTVLLNIKREPCTPKLIKLLVKLLRMQRITQYWRLRVKLKEVISNYADYYLVKTCRRKSKVPGSALSPILCFVCSRQNNVALPRKLAWLKCARGETGNGHHSKSIRF